LGSEQRPSIQAKHSPDRGFLDAEGKGRRRFGRDMFSAVSSGSPLRFNGLPFPLPLPSPFGLSLRIGFGTETSKWRKMSRSTNTWWRASSILQPAKHKSNTS
jgi:hypothetical protein